MRYNYDVKEQTVTVHPRGVLGLSDILEYLNKLRDDPNVGTLKTEIVHFDDVTDFTITYSDIKSVLNAYEETMVREKGLALIVFVAPQDLQFGMARMVGGIFGDRFKTRAVRSVVEIDAAPDRS